jgi:hypothetical protein
MGRHRGRSLVALLSAAALLCVPSGRSAAWGAVQSAQSTLIVPGRSLGPAQIGMPVARLRDALGPSVAAADGRLTFPRWGIAATIQDGTVVRLSTASPRFRTASGAGVGTPRDEASRLVGDLNEAIVRSGGESSVLYPFQGIGFVFRDRQAVQVFVVERIVLGSARVPESRTPPPGTVGAPSTTVRPETPASAPSGLPLPAALGAPAPSKPAAPVPGTLAVNDLAETVDPDAALFRVTGRLVNTGTQPAGPVTLTATFERVSGDETTKPIAVSTQVPAGGSVMFATEASIAEDLVVRYTIRLPSEAAANAAVAQETREVPRAAYVAFARTRIRVDAELGAPSNTAPAVQVLVSIIGTRPIPIAWISDVRVSIPYDGTAQEVHLVPGQTQTIYVPVAAPAPAGTVGSGLGGAVAQGGVGAPLIGRPQVLDVTLGGA